MTKISFALAALLAASLASQLGCKKDTHADPPAPGTAKALPTTPTDGPATRPTTYKCESFRDCTVSCDVRRECCGELCQCTQPYHREELLASRAKKREICTEASEACPEADCPNHPTDFVPRCTESRCTAAQVPRYMGRQTFTCKSSTDCVVAKDRENQCCGELCFATQVYHKDQLAEIQAINDQRCTDEERKWCPQAKCAKPTTRVVGECVQGQCRGKQAPF